MKTFALLLLVAAATGDRGKREFFDSDLVLRQNGIDPAVHFDFGLPGFGFFDLTNIAGQPIPSHPYDQIPRKIPAGLVRPLLPTFLPKPVFESAAVPYSAGLPIQRAAPVILDPFRFSAEDLDSFKPGHGI